MSPAKFHSKDEKSDTKENVVALSVFGVLILVVVGIFTNGFGFFAKGGAIDMSQRISVPIEADPIRGELSTAKVSIIIFSDFQCPFCKKGEDTIQYIFDKYQGDVALVFKHFPLTKIHPDAYNAALAAECANAQGKFWEYHDVLFNNQAALGVDNLNVYAGNLGLDTVEFSECLNSQRYSASVDRDTALGRTAGVTGTPSFFVNGVMIVGSQPATEFEKVIDAELKK